MLNRRLAPPFGEIDYPSFSKVEKAHLSTGVPIYILHAGEQSVVKFDLKLKSGSWYEHQKAVAWFTAKMLPQGTTRQSANDISQAFESMGACIEIEPGFDDVTISVYGMYRNFTDVLGLFLEVLTTPSFLPEELDTLKALRVDEIKINDSKSNMLASKKMREALFGFDHPYGKALTTADIQAIEPLTVKEYYASHFFCQPEIFISGKADDLLIRWIQENFDIPVQNGGMITKAPAAISTPNLYVEKKSSLQSSVRLAWHCPVLGSEDYFDFVISVCLLGGYFGSRLMKNIREEKGYTYGISAYPVDLKHHSFCTIGSEVKAEYTQATIDEIWKEIELLKNGPTEKEEIEMVVNYLAGKFQSSLSTPFKVMGKFMKIHQAGLDYGHYEAYFAHLKNFSQEKLQQSISKHFDHKSVHQVVVGSLTS